MTWTAIAWAVAVPVLFHLTGWVVYLGIVLHKVGCRGLFAEKCVATVLITTFAWEDDLVEFLFPTPAASYTPANQESPGRLVVESPAKFASDNA